MTSEEIDEARELLRDLENKVDLFRDKLFSDIVKEQFDESDKD